MSPPRRQRPLSSEERRLWAEVARGVSPLAGRTLPVEPDPVSAPAPPGPVPATPVASRPKPPATPALPPLAPLERRTLVGLRRGARPVDAVLDLHGLRQAEAHRRLLAFLHRAQGEGRQLVLVVTGKGAGDLDLAGERGVLRRMVPHWLRLPDLRPLVLGFDQAAPHHGGAGALYIRLRRRRSPGGSGI